jgi:very-short-patch-repair endonuclease
MPIFICRHCLLEKHNNNSLRNHERLCKNNPNKQESNFKKYNKNRKGPWNKGLTKDIDDRVRQNADAVSNAKKGIAPGFTWTEKLRKEQSERKKKLYKEFPEKHPNRKLANNKAKMSYPEKIAYEWFVNSDIEFSHNKKIDKFYPDFVVDNIIVEIDGEYWHNIEADKIRDSILNSLGYIVYRIKSKENIQKRLEEIFRV